MAAFRTLNKHLTDTSEPSHDIALLFCRTLISLECKTASYVPEKTQIKHAAVL